MKTAWTTCRAESGRRGMTLIEATITMAIVSGLMVASVATLSASARARQVQSSYGRGYVLAQDLLEEILSVRYLEPEDPPTFGREQGEHANNRNGWDDVDDYNGWSTTTPKHKSGGGTLPGLGGWSQQVSVVWADPNNPAADSATDQGLVRITVTVTDPRGRQSILTGLRGRQSIFDTAPSEPGSRVQWIGMNVQIGNDAAAAVSAGTAVANRPLEP